MLRGKWVLENLLSAAPPPPPADVPALKTETAAGKPLTLRERDEQHRAERRHARAATRGWTRSASRWKTSTRSAGGANATASSRSTRAASSLKGRSSTEFAGLKKVLLRQPEQFVGTVTERLLMYASAATCSTMTRRPCAP